MSSRVERTPRGRSFSLPRFRLSSSLPMKSFSRFLENGINGMDGWMRSRFPRFSKSFLSSTRELAGENLGLIAEEDRNDNVSKERVWRKSCVFRISNRSRGLRLDGWSSADFIHLKLSLTSPPNFHRERVNGTYLRAGTSNIGWKLCGIVYRKNGE